MNRYNWSRLNHLQVGGYAEYFTKMKLTMAGLDIYGAEVDDRGIDFVARSNAGRYYDFQVKAVRGMNYIFFHKYKFEPRDNLIAAVVIFFDGKVPELFLIPSAAWRTPNALFVNRDCGEKKSKP
jgi:hypothetical protein